MSIENLNLLAHATSAVLPILTRTGSIPRIVDVVLSAMPLSLSVLGQLSSWHAHAQYFDNAAQFYAKFSWYLLPEGLTIGHTLSPLLTPEILGKATTLLSDTGLLVAGAIGSLRLFQIGITGRDHTLDIPYTSPAQRAFCTILGTAGLAQVVDAIKNRVLGLFVFQSLDPEQQYFVLKHRSVETLGRPMKSCRAVIIDGSSSKWGGCFDDHPDPMAEELYRKCEVRTYRVDPNSTVPGCDAAEKGEKALGGSVDVLAFLGHTAQTTAGNMVQKLNKDTYFWGDSDETACLKDHLQPDAQVLFAGCNSATGNNSLTKKVSRHLNGIEVVGFATYFNPYLSIYSWKGKKLRIWSWFPIDNQGNWIFPWSNIVRTFKSMESNVQS